MKNLLLFIVLAFVCVSVKAQQRWGFEYGLNYLHVKPVGGMGVIIQRGDGVTFNFGMVKPGGHFAFGLDISLAQYGRDKSRQEYKMEDGSFAPMDIIVSNSFATLTTYSRWYMATKGLVRPYLVGKVGYSGFTTDLNIYDPDDNDHCKPVENEVLYDDGTWIVGVGAGVKLDFASVFRKLPIGKFYLESSVTFTQGGEVRYMSENADANHANNNTVDSDHVYAKFINTETQIIHEHHVGHLYRSPVQMTEFRVGFSMTILR